MIKEDMLNEIIQGDCLEVMRDIPDGSVDMILADLPYGTTACRWDSIIPFEPLWKQYERIIKDNGAIVLTAAQPFTSALVMSNPKIFRYEWIWEKSKATLFQHANRMPLRGHENVCVFYKRLPTYNPQKVFVGVKDNRKTFSSRLNNNEFTAGNMVVKTRKDDGWRFPVTVQKFNNSDRTKQLHPTQKPVALFEYLIRTYTDEGELVLDNVIGSGTTAVAAIKTGRNFIGIEQELEYVEIAKRRVDEARAEKEGDS